MHFFFFFIQDKRSRTVHQFQFISWPDHGVPETATAAIDFVSCIHAMVQPMHGPILVHCRLVRGWGQNTGKDWYMYS